MEPAAPQSSQGMICTRCDGMSKVHHKARQLFYGAGKSQTGPVYACGAPPLQTVSCPVLQAPDGSICQGL